MKSPAPPQIVIFHDLGSVSERRIIQTSPKISGKTLLISIVDNS